MKNNKYSENEKINFSVTFNYMLEDYKDVSSRSRAVDSKVGMFLAFLSVIIPFYIQIINIDCIKQVFHNLPNVSAIESAFLSLFFLSILVYFLDFSLFAFILFSKKYFKLQSYSEVFKNDKFDYKSFSKVPVSAIYINNIHNLANIIEDNVHKIENKSRCFMIAVILCAIYNFFMVASCIFIVILV